jgi:DHA1 family multidrug resistance protein-like MFS transporter
MAEHYQEGIVRTASNRQTYAPDGLLTSNYHIPQYTEQQTQYHSRVASISGTTTAHSTRSSISGDDDQNLKTKGKTGLPAGFATGSNEENFSSEADVEMQRQRTNRSSLNENDDEKDDGEEEKKDPNLVEWDGDDDPENPQNFPARKKWMVTVVAGLMTFSVTFASSVFSTATTVTSQLFGVSSEVMILGTSLFVLGFAFGKLEGYTVRCMILTRIRTDRLESFLGAIWPQDPSVHWILRIRHLPNPCRGWSNPNSLCTSPC